MWEGNGKEILKFFEWEANGKELISFFSEKEGKRKEKIGKSVRNLPKTGQKLVKIQNFV